MRVVLINPRVTNTPDHPLGMLYIASVLERKGNEVFAVDMLAETEPKTIAEKALSFKPDIIGITSSTAQIEKGYMIAEEIKNMKDIKIVFGGIHPTSCPKEVLSKKCVDCVVIGEGELTMPELLERPPDKVKGVGYKDNGKMLFNEPRPLIKDLDSLPFPARHLLPSKWYFKPPKVRGTWTNSTAMMMASRGCPYHCIFCCSYLIFGRKVRRRSIKNVIEEIEHLRNKYNIDTIYFRDDTFTINTEWVKEFCKQLINKKWGDFSWACQIRANTALDFEMLQLMKKSGCKQVDMGIESGSQKVLNILKKGITIKQIEEAFRLIKKAKLKSFVSIIVGTPDETLEDIKKTEKILDNIKPDFVDFFFMTPYPKTEVYDIAKNRGLIKDSNYFNFFMNKKRERPVVCFYPNEQQLIRIRNTLHNKFLLRNYMTEFSRPRNILGGLEIFIGGFPGLIKSFPRFLRSRKIEDIFQAVLNEYRIRIRYKDY